MEKKSINLFYRSKLLCFYLTSFFCKIDLGLDTISFLERLLKVCDSQNSQFFDPSSTVQCMRYRYRYSALLYYSLASIASIASIDIFRQMQQMQLFCHFTYCFMIFFNTYFWGGEGGSLAISDQRSRSRSRRGWVSKTRIAVSISSRLFFLTALAISIAPRLSRNPEISVSISTTTFVFSIHSLGLSIKKNM